MPDRIKRLGVCSLIVSTLVVSSCILTLYNINANAQVSENTLESLANQTGVSGNITQIDTGEFPKQIDAALDLDQSGIIYVINSGSNTVSVIDKITNTVKQTIPVGGRSCGYTRR
jgi:YVTN family beta-propeller protein